MKNFAFIVLFFATQLAFSQAPDKSLLQWKGQYSVTKCIECPDFQVESGANLKFFSWFGIGAGEVEQGELPDCASTNVWMGISHEITSEDKGIQDLTSHSPGLCYWNNGKKVTATSNRLEYFTDGSLSASQKSIHLIITKRTDGLYDFYIREIDPTPSWGFPTDYVLKAELKKISEESIPTGKIPASTQIDSNNTIQINK